MAADPSCQERKTGRQPLHRPRGQSESRIGRDRRGRPSESRPEYNNADKKTGRTTQGISDVCLCSPWAEALSVRK